MAKDKENVYEARHLDGERFAIRILTWTEDPKGKPVQVLDSTYNLSLSTAKEEVAHKQAAVKDAKAILAAIKAAQKVAKKKG